MALLYPIGLLALAGLIVPVLIHLWSVKRGRILKIGSIALLGENATASSKSIKIADILLFILRCLIILLIAFVLAAPYLKSTIYNQKDRGWILINKTQINQAYQTYHSTIDSLLKLGFELHDFNLGFNEFTLKDSSANNSVTGLSYTALLNQLNTQIPKGYSAYIFADRKIQNFKGSFAKVNFNFVWNVLQDSDSVKTWHTTFLNKKYEGKSTPAFTSYTSNLTQDFPPIRVAIYETDGNDSKYIKAALNAIADFTGRKIEISSWNSLSSTNADVMFWLSAQPISFTEHKKGSTLLVYQQGKTLATHSTIQISSNPDEGIGLKKRIAPDSIAGRVIWADGFGNPILVKENNSNFNYYHFYSRFNPQWTDLVWNENFVKAFIPIVLGYSNGNDFGFEDHDSDQRVLAAEQLPVSHIHATNASATTNHQDLSTWIWLLTFVLLIIERVLSLRKRTN